MQFSSKAILSRYLLSLLLGLVVVTSLLWLISLPISRGLETLPELPERKDSAISGVQFCNCIYDAEYGEVERALEGVGCNVRKLEIAERDQLPECSFECFDCNPNSVGSAALRIYLLKRALFPEQTEPTAVNKSLNTDAGDAGTG